MNLKLKDLKNGVRSTGVQCLGLGTVIMLSLVRGHSQGWWFLSWSVCECPLHMASIVFGSIDPGSLTDLLGPHAVQMSITSSFSQAHKSGNAPP